MKVLFIGGTGNISSACSQLAVSKGFDLYHLNRGKSSNLRKVEGVKTIIADIRNYSEAEKALDNHSFDVVVDFIAFEPEHIQADIRFFSGKIKQFVFISSASAYQTPPQKLPVTEETPLENPVWEYSQKKIACENILKEEYRKTGFPYTILRPSHTYDKASVPVEGGFTVLSRMIRNAPIIVHGDGSSIWTLTYNKDFAVGLVGLLGNPAAINEAFHITSDEWLSWDTIYKTLAKELGVEPQLVHVPSEWIARYDKRIGDSLLGDKTHSMIFDNSKIRKFVPEYACKVTFAEGAKEIVKWYKENAATLYEDESINNFMDKIVWDLLDCKMIK
jgi:nucleoside-diphosphate-sugar epimerase